LCIFALIVLLLPWIQNCSLIADGHTVQGPQESALFGLLIAFGRNSQGLRPKQLHERVQLAVALFDAGQVLLHDVYAGGLSLTD
jgi:hypothetical protein